MTSATQNITSEEVRIFNRSDANVTEEKVNNTDSMEKTEKDITMWEEDTDEEDTDEEDSS